MNEKVKYIFVLGAFVMLCVIGYFSLPKDEIVIQPSLKEEKEELIYVHIEGCVQKTGLIRATKGVRLYELIELAGGATEEADLSKVNLASIVSDGQKVYIPKVVIEGEEGKTSSISQEGIVNINTASLEELQMLDGIGPSMASKILRYREEHGYFTQIEDMMNVSGIGAGKFEKIKNKITL